MIAMHGCKTKGMSFETTIARPLTALTTAVFIDADNLSAGHAGTILKHAGPAPRLLRAYGDATKAKAWRAHHAVEFRDTGTGKNASDLALAVDAMNAAHLYGLTHILICSSDGDFRHLALALRKIGVAVTGMGEEAKRPKPFADVCGQWISLKELSKSNEQCSRLSDRQLCEKLRDFIRTNSKQGKGVTISELNNRARPELTRQDDTVGARWRNCLNDEKLFDIRKTDTSGAKLPEPMVRFRQEGFLNAS